MTASGFRFQTLADRWEQADDGSLPKRTIMSAILLEGAVPDEAYEWEIVEDASGDFVERFARDAFEPSQPVA